jgi:hypothetical protein
MLLWQNGTEKHAKQCSREDACEYDEADLYRFIFLRALGKKGLGMGPIETQFFSAATAGIMAELPPSDER